MPIATPEQYRQMLDATQEGGYACPAIHITSLTSPNGALKAFSEAHSDGVIQLSIRPARGKAGVVPGSPAQQLPCKL